MAGSRIKGITIEIEGNTTKLQSALSGVNKDLKTTQASLKDVNSLLKLDPANVTLLKQKQELLTKAIEDTKKKLETEKEALKQLKEGDQTPEVIAQQQALERQIAADEAALESLEKETGIFQSAGLQAFFAVGEKVKEAGEKIKDVGETITQKVTVPLAALAGASIAAFKNVDDGYDEMIKKTGATGKEAEALRQIMENIASEIPTDFDTAGRAIGEVSTRFGVAGDDLEDLSSLFIKFADLNNTDVTTSIDNVQKALAAYGLDAEYAEEYLNRLNKTGQETGVKVDKLAQGMVTNGAAFQEMGLNIDQATVFMGQLEKSGANSETVMNGLRKALKNATKEGKPMNQALEELQDTILNGTDGMDGLTASYELFGKSGDQIYGAVKNGTVNFKELGRTLSASGRSIENTFKETQDPIDQFKTTMNRLKITGAELGSTLLTVLEPAIAKVTEIIGKIKEKWDSLSPAQQEMIVKIGLVVAAIGPVITILGTLIAAIGALMSPIGLVVIAIAAAIAAGVLLYKNWDKIKAKAKELWKELKDRFAKIKDSIVGAFTKTKEKIVSIWESIKSFFINVWNTIKNTVSTAIETVKTTVTQKFQSVKNTIMLIWGVIATFFVTTWETIKKTVATAIDTVKTKVTTVFNTVRNTVQTVWSTISNVITNAWSVIKSTVSSAVNTVSSTVSTVFTSIRSTASSIWEGIKYSVSTAAEGLKSSAVTAFTTLKNNSSTIFEGIKTAITHPISTAKTMVEGYVNGIKSFLQFTGVYDNVLSVFNTIKTAITNPIETAKTLVNSAIETIKSYFPFNLGNICELKLPHISVDAGSAPWGIGGKGRKPSFSIEWYAKGGIFQQPTLFATPSGFKGVGEAGAEAVLPLDALWTQMDAMADTIVKGVAQNQNAMANAMYSAMIAAFQQLDFSIDGREFARILRNYGAIA